MTTSDFVHENDPQIIVKTNKRMKYSRSRRYLLKLDFIRKANIDY